MPKSTAALFLTSFQLFFPLLLLLIIANHFTSRANVVTGKLEEIPFFFCLLIFLSFTLWQVIAITRRFR
jgi:hypothetical protein